MSVRLTAIAVGSLIAGICLGAWASSIRTGRSTKAKPKKSPNVSEAVLFQGVWWALEQAGRLLRAATQVYDQGDIATGVALAMLAREELGRSRLLLEAGTKVHLGEQLSVDDLRKRLANHIDKQRHGALSVTMEFEPGSKLHKAALSRFKSKVGSDEWKRASKVIDGAAADIERRQPSQRHQDRMSATYVDLADDGAGWLRPTDFDPGTARRSIEDAANDYSVAWDRYRDEMLAVPGIERAIPEAAFVRAHKPPGVVLPAPSRIRLTPVADA